MAQKLVNTPVGKLTPKAAKYRELYKAAFDEARAQGCSEQESHLRAGRKVPYSSLR